MITYSVSNETKPRTPSRPVVFLARALFWSWVMLQSTDRVLYGLKGAASSLNSVIFTSQKK